MKGIYNSIFSYGSSAFSWAKKSVEPWIPQGVFTDPRTWQRDRVLREGTKIAVIGAVGVGACVYPLATVAAVAGGVALNRLLQQRGISLFSTSAPQLTQLPPEQRDVTFELTYAPDSVIEAYTRKASEGDYRIITGEGSRLLSITIPSNATLKDLYAVLGVTKEHKVQFIVGGKVMEEGQTLPDDLGLIEVRPHPES